MTAQNPSLVSVRLLVLESVRIPLGLAIAGGVGVGLMAGALLQLFVRRP
nr:lipopolysaccharide assembly protein LapA domain-containing protein [Synechococcus elongatus]